MATNRGNRYRQHRHEVCLSDNEEIMMKERMEYVGITNASDYIRRMIIDGGIIVIGDAEEVRRTNYEINKIGTNINQIAHLANSKGSVSAKDVDDLKEMMVNIWQLLRFIQYIEPSSHQ